MSCYSPLTALELGINPKTGKKNIVVITANSAISARDYRDAKKIYIPCGKCIGCRLDYSRQWADRMLLESMYHQSTFFVTLTYNDKFLPPKRLGSEIHSLDKRELQLFIKRLRKNTGQKIRYYACGEYGEQNMRPHYHLIIFGLELADLTYYKRSPNGDIYYNSKTIEDCWTIVDKKGNAGPCKGFCVVSPATWECMAYTARYVTKKIKGHDAEIYKEFNYEPEFSLCSRKPGLGRPYLDDNCDTIYGDGNIVIPTDKGAKTIMVPKYFDRVATEINPEIMELRKKDAEDALVNKVHHKLSLTDVDFFDMLDNEGRVKSSQSKALRRKL